MCGSMRGPDFAQSRDFKLGFPDVLTVYFPIQEISIPNRSGNAISKLFLIGAISRADIGKLQTLAQLSK